MLDFDKVSFNEMDNDEIPIQFFFNYELNQKEIDEWIVYYTDENDIDEKKNVVGIELCLNMYSKYDYKIEAILSYDDNTKEWIEIVVQTNDADKFIDIILNTDTKTAKEAYARYLYVLEH